MKKEGQSVEPMVVVVVSVLADHNHGFDFGQVCCRVPSDSMLDCVLSPLMKSMVGS